MPLSFEDEIGADYDSDAKTEARRASSRGGLHKQKQGLIHRPTATTARFRQWLPVAALIPLLILGLAWPRMQAVVRAEELLTLASDHARSLPANHRQLLRFQLTPGIPALTLVTGGTRAGKPRVTPFFAVRHVTGGVVHDAGPDGAGASGDDAELAALLSSAWLRFQPAVEPRQPARVAFVAGREARRGVRSQRHARCSRPRRPIGALRSVELTVRRRDYHVLKLEFAFDGKGRLEIAEIPPTTMPRAVKASPVAPIAPTVTAPVALSAPSSLASRGVVVDASLSPVTTVVGRAPVSQPGLSRWLDRTFRASPERKTFVPTLQRLVGDVRQHLSELDTLGRRYPELEVEQQWSSADRVALRRRVEESYRRISRDLNDLELRVSVLFGSRTRSFPLTEAPADWRRARGGRAGARGGDGRSGPRPAEFRRRAGGWHGRARGGAGACDVCRVVGCRARTRGWAREPLGASRSAGVPSRGCRPLSTQVPSSFPKEISSNMSRRAAGFARGPLAFRSADFHNRKVG